MNKFIWLMLTVLCLVLAWVAESQMLAWTAGFFLLTILVSRLLVAFPPRVEATRVISTNYAYPGDKVRVWVRLRLIRPPLTWLMLHDFSPPLPGEGEQGILLGPGSRKEFEFSYTLQALRRGYYSLGPLTLSYSDPLGFFEKRRTILLADKLTIFPNLKEMRPRRLPQVQTSGELLTLRRAFEDPSCPAGIREYRQGDSLRRIHWRATAHIGRTQSKVYDVSTSLSAMLLLNLYRPDYPTGPAETIQTSELAFSLTASLALHLLAAGQRVGLISNGSDPKSSEVSEVKSDEALEKTFQKVQLAPGRTPEKPLEILSLLGRLQLAQQQTLGQAIAAIRPTLSWGDVLFIITPGVNAEVIGQLTGLEHAGFSLFALIPGDSPAAARSQMQLVAAGIAAERIISESDIAGVFG